MREKLTNNRLTFKYRFVILKSVFYVSLLEGYTNYYIMEVTLSMVSVASFMEDLKSEKEKYRWLRISR